MVLSNGFGPVEAPDAETLVLGTLPGAASLAKSEYYAQPWNALWAIIERIFDVRREAPYVERVAALRTHRIALWDVCGGASRLGGLDANIALKTVTPNDIRGFLDSHPGVRHIYFNGRKAEDLFQRLVAPSLGSRADKPTLVVLPSTSAAYASMSLERKIGLWRGALTGATVSKDRGCGT